MVVKYSRYRSFEGNRSAFNLLAGMIHKGSCENELSMTLSQNSFLPLNIITYVLRWNPVSGNSSRAEECDIYHFLMFLSEYFHHSLTTEQTTWEIVMNPVPRIPRTCQNPASAASTWLWSKQRNCCRQTHNQLLLVKTTMLSSRQWP